MNLIIETINGEGARKYIRKGYVSTGHGCWGEPEGYTYYYVILGGKEIKVDSKDYIAHNGESILDVGRIDYLSNNLSEHLIPSLKEEHKKERYKRYLSLKKEFDIKSDENTMIARDVDIEEIIK